MLCAVFKKAKGGDLRLCFIDKKPKAKSKAKPKAEPPRPGRRRGPIVARVASEGTPGLRYELRRGKDGGLYCNCHAWRFQKRPPRERTCKHLDKYLAKHPA